MEIEFDNRFEKVAAFDGNATPDEIKNETMFFSCDPGFVYDHCGPLTKRILLAATRFMNAPAGLHSVIDTRVHMLMPGQYPAIPGWHCDAVPRKEYGDQPDFSLINPEAKHYVCTISSDTGGVSNTEFLVGPLSVDVDPNRVWSSVNAQIPEEQPIRSIPDGCLVEFGSMAIHRAAPATKWHGWRLFFRLSYMQNPPRNEIRRQTQVYTNAGLGW
jgi:hypothetical protein